ncbi:MAG TPA: LysE family transporter [Dongiaceae bacterium]|nr:LysE family transporter [Dongiaceae bacterium]
MIDLLLLHSWIWAQGAAIGFAVAAPVGPIGMLCIKTTLEKGRLAGFCAGLGAAVADTIFAAIGALAISLVGNFLSMEQNWFKLGAGIFLIVFGLYLARKPAMLPENGEKVPPGLWAEFAVTLLLTLANPSTILSFAAVFAGVTAGGGYALETMPALITGVFIGAAAWWLTLGQIVGLIRHKISQAGLVMINRGAGLALVAFGLFNLAQLYWRQYH